jgi:RecA/RadA recombinase
MSKFLNSIVKTSGNKLASIVEDGCTSDIRGFVDTGSYSFNALLSGSIYGGIPTNKIVGIAGESATGKTFYTLGIVKHFLELNPEAVVLYFDSEEAVSTEEFTSHGIDTGRVAHLPVSTVEEFGHQVSKILDSYGKQSEQDKKPLMIVLDSLGMLSTTKETTDQLEGKEVTDMTRSKVIKRVFRTLTLKMGVLRVPMVVTNHTYDVIGNNYPSKAMGGGGGLKYAASIVVFLSKRKEKVDNEVIGQIIHCKIEKSRKTRDGKSVDTILTYDKGLDRYYGLLAIALKHGIFKKTSTKVELPDGSTEYESRIQKNPTKYFTKQILDLIDAAAAKEFKFGSIEDDGMEEESDEDPV